MTEQEKMKLGMWYDANNDEELRHMRVTAQSLMFDLNQTRPSDIEKKEEIITELLGEMPEGLDLITPFYFDYGYNIHIGKNVFINLNCYFMDCASITIGDHTFIGPYCGFYTATHPISYKERNKGLEKALPIKVGKNCWFGANVSIMPGVTIGDGCVIGAGSVVTKDIPDHSIVSGVPAVVKRKIEE